MKINTLRNKYTFTKDSHCITLYKETKVQKIDSKNYGQDISSVIGHFSNIKSMVEKIVFLELIDKGTLNELLNDFAEVIKQFDVGEILNENRNKDTK